MTSSVIVRTCTVLASAIALSALAIAGCGEPFVAGSGSGGGMAGNGGSGGDASSTGSSTGGGGAAPSCAGPGEPCGDCVALKCPAAYCPCTKSSACEKLVMCYEQCQPGDALWAQYCRGQTPNAISYLALISHCEATSCVTECGGAGQALDPCTACMYGSCTNYMNACLGDAECAKAVACMSQCNLTDTACFDACAQQSPGAGSKLADLRMCQKSQCTDACNG